MLSINQKNVWKKKHEEWNNFSWITTEKITFRKNVKTNKSLTDKFPFLDSKNISS